ncbi:binding protein [Perilla frutescens var. hirtella]|nr:binding protein [Perilla frutescens var. hirtella]
MCALDEPSRHYVAESIDGDLGANQLNLDTHSALKHLFGVVANGGLSKLLDNAESKLAVKSKQVLTDQIVGEKPDREKFIGRLLVGLPSEKKGSKFFNISVRRSKSVSEGHKKISVGTQPIFSIVSDRLFKFPQTDLLSATLFDVLLGGASPKQLMGMYAAEFNNKFVLSADYEDSSSRVKIMGDLLDLLDSNPSNIEAYMENGWNSWLLASTKLDVLMNYKVKMGTHDSEIDEQCLVKSVYSLVLCHYILSVKVSTLPKDRLRHCHVFTETRGEFGIRLAAQFGSADLKRANFTPADMRESNFSGSTFNGAYLEKAVAYKAKSQVIYHSSLH